MENTKHKGDNGEKEARQFLKNLGYKIHRSNLRIGHREIDIVAIKDGLMVFVEVKLRTTEYYGGPENALTRKQQMNIVEASDEYVKRINWAGDIRFDIIAIIQNGYTFRILHFEDAFWPFTT
jgi:putative endonuclease